MQSKVEISIELRLGLDNGACAFLQVGLNLLRRSIRGLLRRNAVDNRLELRTGFQRAVDLASQAGISILHLVRFHRCPPSRLTHQAIERVANANPQRAANSVASLRSQGEISDLGAFRAGTRHATGGRTPSRACCCPPSEPKRRRDARFAIPDRRPDSCLDDVILRRSARFPASSPRRTHALGRSRSSAVDDGGLLDINST
jgi:hypothetical protein